MTRDTKIKSSGWAIGAMALLLILTATSCDLDIEASDSVIAESGGPFAGVKSPESAVNDLYTSIYNNLEGQTNLFALQEVSTDELLVPTRGTDWGDNGIWRTLHTHTWDASHQYVRDVWNQMNQNVYRATEVLDPKSKATAGQEADARFVRAFSMYNVMDLYGQVPFRSPNDPIDKNPEVISRSDAYQRVLDDLEEALKGLPDTGPGNNNQRATVAAANFLKARLLLNAHIYKGTDEPSEADLNGVIAAVDAIEAAGYGLEKGYFNLFKPDTDKETIWFVQISVGNRIWDGLHYNQNSPGQAGGWNGFSTLAEFYAKFEGKPENTVGNDQEERRGFVPDLSNSDDSNLGIGYGFLIGQQFGAPGFKDGKPTGPYEALKDRAGNPLVFVKEFPGLVGNNERTGIRVIKYHPVNGAYAKHSIIFRFADAHLMRAEAMQRLDRKDEAKAEINELRVLREAKPLAEVTYDDILDERGRELYMEFVRRPDMIRFGKFTEGWELKPKGSEGDKTKLLYPIPAEALLSNPNLTQNPGY